MRLLSGLWLLVILAIGGSILRASTSCYPLRPDDSQAVYVGVGEGGAVGDGVADDTAALQRAIDRVQETTRRGVVFVGPGRYRLTRALLVWSGIRLIGYGSTRPVFYLAPNTPGYAEGEGRYLVLFVSDRPVSPDQPVRDANPGTFYSALSNVDFEIADGNPAAIAVRSHYAQHGFLSHLEFRLGTARAGVEEVGNESEDLRFIGGEFGITTRKPSPSWPFLLIDTVFEGQRRAAIESEEAGLTLVRVTFRDVPTAVLVRPGRSEELFIEDSRFERIRGPALVISEERSARTQVNVRNSICVDVPVFARLRESHRETPGPAPIYRVDEFCHGLQFAALDAPPELKTTFATTPLTAAPPPVPSDLAALPPMETWVNLRTLGAVGDGRADDTAALRAAIAAHRTIYLPSGRYRVTDTILLRSDTVLIGFNPITTQILIDDYTPAFQGVNAPLAPPEVPAEIRAWWMPAPFPGRGAPVPLLDTPRGGTNILTGLGLDTGGINNRAVGLRWRAGARSLVNDVRFLGGHGTYDATGRQVPLYTPNHSADPNPQRRWDSQYWSLWVTEGGGGVFKDIWTPNPFAAAGLYVSDTDTPGRVYALSSEHHVRHEVRLRRVSGWRFYALQTEEELGEGPHTLPLDLDACRDIAVANFFIYRVKTPAPAETGIRLADSRDLRFAGLHVYSPGKLSFDNTVVDRRSGRPIRAREIAALKVPGASVAPASPTSGLERVASGFTAIDGLVVRPDGGVNFVDSATERIFRWSRADGLSLVTDSVPEPGGLMVDRAGGLVIVSRHGNVYALPSGADESAISVLVPQPAAPRPEATPWLPVNRWRDDHDWIAANTRAEPLHYVALDGSAFLPAPAIYAQLGRPESAWRGGTIDVVRAYAFAPAQVGAPFYVADEFGQKTWRFTVSPDGTLSAPGLFAEEGEAGVTVDAAGRVYVCAGDVFVYDRDGHLVETLVVPERPAAVVFGDADRRTLYIAARTSLYALRRDPP